MNTNEILEIIGLTVLLAIIIYIVSIWIKEIIKKDE